MYTEQLLSVIGGNIKMYSPYPKRLVNYLWEKYLEISCTYPEAWKRIMDEVARLDSECPDGYIEKVLEVFSSKIEAYENANKEFDMNCLEADDIEAPQVNQDEEELYEVLYSMGYRKKEIQPALETAYNHVTDKTDQEQVLRVVLKILTS
jgi:hypothetical protein